MLRIFTQLLVVAILFMAVSCKKDENTLVPDTGEYLPLQIDNYWLIDHYDQIDITGTQVLDNKTYFVLVQGTDTNYYRNVNNKIYVRRSDVSESVKFDLTADVNESWQFQGWIVTMASKTDTITINNTKIPNCYHFFFDIPMVVDDEHSIYLAPGIGFINMTCGFCPYPALKLVKANINNVEITFP
jgi:hypothetical protein